MKNKPLVLKPKETRKQWEQSRSRKDKVEYRPAKKTACKAVAVAKAEACRELYEELETPEGEKRLYQIARNRNKATKDVNHVKQVKDANVVILRDERTNK